MNIPTILHRPAIWVCAAFSLLASCISDVNDVYVSSGIELGEMREVEIKLNVVSQSPPSSRQGGSTVDDDLQVNDLYIVAFGAEETDKRYLYSSRATYDAEKGKWKTNVITSTGKQSFVMIANAESSTRLNKSLGVLLTGAMGKTKEELFSDFYMTSSPQAGEPLIMVGETDATVVSEQTVQTDLFDAKMFPMVAKLNFYVGKTVTPPSGEGSSSTIVNGTGIDGFELTSLYLYNFQGKGMVVPNVNLEHTVDGWEPTIPVAQDGKYEAPVKQMQVYQKEGTEAVNTVENVYFFETGQPDRYRYEGLPEEGYDLYTYRPCIIVGGKWQGGKEKFWRIDLKNTAGKFSDIMRCQSYNVTITDVTGDGAETPEAAGGANIVVKIRKWDSKNLDEVTLYGDSDKSYFLGVESQTIMVSRSSKEFTQTFIFSKGCTLEVSHSLGNTINYLIVEEEDLPEGFKFTEISKTGNYLYGSVPEDNSSEYAKITVTYTTYGEDWMGNPEPVPMPESTDFYAKLYKNYVEPNSKENDVAIEVDFKCMVDPDVPTLPWSLDHIDPESIMIFDKDGNFIVPSLDYMGVYAWGDNYGFPEDGVPFLIMNGYKGDLVWNIDMGDLTSEIEGQVFGVHTFWTRHKNDFIFASASDVEKKYGTGSIKLPVNDTGEDRYATLILSCFNSQDKYVSYEFKITQKGQ